MRATLNIEDQVIEAAKIAAVEHGETLTKLIQESLRAEFQHSREGQRVTLPIAPRGSGPRLSIDFSRTSALLDRLDEREIADADS